MNGNRFCLLLLLAILVFIIVGIFLVASSLHYPDQEEEIPKLLIRRDIKQDHKSKPEEPVPVFPEDYHASGLLILPHSSIAEPFEIWFSNTLGASRIDYYYGTDKSFQRGDEEPYGKYYKVVPMYNDRQGNFEGCWTVTGRKNWPINAQTVIPNMTWFKYEKTEVYTGTLATKWHYEYWAYGMLNSQNVWVTKSKPYRPIRYEMKGYDSMLGSYYDHYVLEYVSFEQWRPQIKRFNLPKGVPCFNWSLTLESSLISNPMQQFATFTAEHLVDTDEMFNDFKKNHGKSYDNKKEHKKRKHIYKHNMRYIHSMNRKNHHFKLKTNHFADMSDEEFETHLGSITKSDPRNHTGMKPLHKHDPVYLGKPPTPVDIPDELDWRDYGAVSPVKGQGICGSCYTFSAAGAAEGAHFLKTGSLVELSSQQILDCSWGSGNHGCKGGHYAAALSFLYLHGAATLNSYGKYLAQEGVCHFNDTLLGAKIDAFAYVPSYNNTALKHAIAKFGPAAVSINVSPLSFKFYSNGVYHDDQCWSNRTRHSALVIGYGKIKNGREYWLVKNSWSDSWGERGYIRVAMDNDMCGVTEAPVVALVNHITFQFPVKEKILSVDSEDEASLGHKVKAMKREEKTKKGKKKETQKEVNVSEKESRKEAAAKEADIIHELKDAIKKNEKIVEIKGKIKSKQKEELKTKTKDEISEKLIGKAGEETPSGLESSELVQGKETNAKVDDKETPKIEPHDENHDIGALGDSVVSNSIATSKEQINVKNAGGKPEEGEHMSFKAEGKEKSDDFKLPAFQGKVDQSKLPNAMPESFTQPSNQNGKNLPSAVAKNEDLKDETESKQGKGLEAEEYRGNIQSKGDEVENRGSQVSVYHASKSGVDVTVERFNGASDVEVSIDDKIEKTKKRNKAKMRKIRSSNKKKLKSSKATVGKVKRNNNIEKLPLSGEKLHKVLQETLKRLYTKIDKSLLKAA